MNDRILITIWKDEIAPRFDLTGEVLMVSVDPEGKVAQQRTVVLPTVSPDDLCHLILTEGITLLICGAIEEEYYQYLTWKRVRVIDSVIGPCEEALEHALRGRLQPGKIINKDGATGGK